MISLVQMEKDGVDIEVVGVDIEVVKNNESKVTNNNPSDVVKSKTEVVEKVVEKEGFEEGKDLSNATDESGYQEANSSLLDGSTSSSAEIRPAVDLNQGFLAC